MFKVQDPMLTFMEVPELVKEIELRKTRGAPLKKNQPVVMVTKF